jgi:hypothetical protein
LQTALDQDAAAFLEVLGGILRRAPPDRDVNEGGFLLPLTVFSRPDTIQGDPEIGDSGAIFGFPEFGLASQVSDECDTIVTAHVFMKTQCVRENKRKVSLFFRSVFFPESMATAAFPGLRNGRPGP